MKWNYLFLILILLTNFFHECENKKFMTTVYLKDKSSAKTKMILPRLTIDSNHKISDYFPFFLQTKILKTSSNSFKTNPDHTSACFQDDNKFCEYCDKSTQKICFRCKKGFYLLNKKCFNTCPKNYVADVFRRQCHPVNERNVYSQITYSKAFTTSSCKNQCGAKFEDCSCEYTCTTQGNCCSDFHNCEKTIMLNKGRVAECKAKEKQLGKCRFCDFHKDECLQCEEGKYLREGKCVSMCNESDRVFSDNKLCLLKHDCGIDYCAQCLPNNNDRCRQCINGYFLFNGQCLEKCPYHYRADRISWQCIDTPSKTLG